MGKVGRGKTFFLKAFGETTTEFRELLLMPEYMIRNRLDCEACGETERWKAALSSLDKFDLAEFKRRILNNDFIVRDEGSCSTKLQLLLSFYQLPHRTVPQISERHRGQMVLEFAEKWRGRSARLSESDIAHDATSTWFFRK